MKNGNWFSRAGENIKDWFSKSYNQKSVFHLLFWVCMLALICVGMEVITHSPNYDSRGDVTGVVIAKAETMCETRYPYIMAVHPLDSSYVDFSREVDYLTYLRHDAGDTVTLYNIPRYYYDPSYSEAGNASVTAWCVVLVLLFVGVLIMVCVRAYYILDDLFDF